MHFSELMIYFNEKFTWKKKKASIYQPPSVNAKEVNEYILGNHYNY